MLKVKLSPSEIKKSRDKIEKLILAREEKILVINNIIKGIAGEVWPGISPSLHIWQKKFKKPGNPRRGVLYGLDN